MNPIDLTFALIENSERYNNPVEYWKKHCVNCGVLAGEAHVKGDCPPQNYEKKNATKTNPKATRGENTMTPTEQDKELRAELQKINSLTESYAELEDRLVDFITADRKRVALEARIDEVKLVAQLFVGLPTKTMKRADLKYYLINRIAELKAQQEEVK